MPLALYIATPIGEAFDAEVEGVVLPGVEGDFGVLEGHEAFISALRAGSLEIQQSDGSRRVAAVPGGFAEISESTGRGRGLLPAVSGCVLRGGGSGGIPELSGELGSL